MAEADNFPAPSESFVLTHVVVSADVSRSRDFYTDVLRGTVVMEGEPTTVKLANSWVTINVGDGPTDDKLDIVLEAPPIPTEPARFSISGWPISTPSTTSGAPGARSSSPHPRTAAERSAAICAIPTVI